MAIPIGSRLEDAWPSLPLEAWSDTYATLHLWTQIVGKIRLAQSPGSTTPGTSRSMSRLVASRRRRSPRRRTFQIDFDFIDHRLTIQSSDGRAAASARSPSRWRRSTTRLMEELAKLDLPCRISKRPNEVADPIRFDRDEDPRGIRPEYANRFWRILVQADRVFKKFRARFIGKCSPVHFFWGAPDLAVTRFSGRRAPEHPGGIPNLPDWVTREAYSHEVSSCGFWPGGGPIPYPAFYSYAYPEPAGFPRRQ